MATRRKREENQMGLTPSKRRRDDVSLQDEVRVLLSDSFVPKVIELCRESERRALSTAEAARKELEDQLLESRLKLDDSISKQEQLQSRNDALRRQVKVLVTSTVRCQDQARSAKTEKEALQQELSATEEERAMWEHRYTLRQEDLKEHLRQTVESAHSKERDQDQPPPYSTVRHRDAGIIVADSLPASVSANVWTDYHHSVANAMYNSRSHGGPSARYGIVKVLLDSCRRLVAIHSPTQAMSEAVSLYAQTVQYLTKVEESPEALPKRTDMQVLWCAVDDLLQQCAERAAEDIYIARRACSTCHTDDCAKAISIQEECYRHAHLAALLHYMVILNWVEDLILEEDGFECGALRWIEDRMEDERRRLANHKHPSCSGTVVIDLTEDE